MAKINELLSNPEFLKRIEATRSVEEAIGIFAQEEIHISEAELRTIFTVPVEDEKGELTEESLECVTGGAELWRLLKPIWPIKPIWNKKKGPFGGGKIGSR